MIGLGCRHPIPPTSENEDDEKKTKTVLATMEVKQVTEDDDVGGDGGLSLSPLSEEPFATAVACPSELNQVAAPTTTFSQAVDNSSCTLQPYLAPKPTRAYAEEQQTIRAAERLLARARSNVGGGGMAADATSRSLRSIYFKSPAEEAKR